MRKVLKKIRTKWNRKTTLLSLAFALLSAMLFAYHGTNTPPKHFLTANIIVSPRISPVATLAPSRIPTPIRIETPMVASAVAPTFPPAQLTSEPTAMPTLAPTAAPLPATDYEAYFDQYSSAYKVDKELLKHIANCESHFHPGSTNGIYGGMFQFAPSTWSSTRASMGADTNPDLRFDAKEAINTAAFKIANGGADAWAACL